MPGREIIGPWLAKKAILEKLGVKHPVVFDVGAHFGNVTEYYLRMFDECNVYSFEPNPADVEKLEKRYANEKRVQVVPKALAHRRYSTKKRFYVGGQAGEMSSLHQRAKHGRRYYRHPQESFEMIYVDVDSVDEFCLEREIPFVHILKLDVQGAELKVLRGATNLLTAGTLPLIYTEVQFVPLYEDAPRFHELETFLYDFGYEVFDIYAQLRAKISRRLTVADVLFVSPQVIKKVFEPMPEEWLAKSLPFALGAPSK